MVYDIRLSRRCPRQDYKDLYLEQFLLVIMVSVGHSFTPVLTMQDKDDRGVYLTPTDTPDIDQVLASVHETLDYHI